MSLKQQMILSQSQLETNYVGQLQHLRPNGLAAKNRTVAGLTLTSLVDCFTILVIYLLVVTNIGAVDVKLNKDITLPVANHSQPAGTSAIVTFVNGQYQIDDQIVDKNSLAEELSKLFESQKSTSLLVQADKLSDYESLNPIVLSGLQAGFEKIGFAVLHEESRQ